MSVSMRRAALPVTLSVSLLLAGSVAACSSSAGDSGPTGSQLLATLGARGQLSAARARWAAKAPARYRYTFSKSCECMPETTQATRVEVERSVGNPEHITSLTYVSGGTAVDGRYQALFPTVDGLFAIIQDAIDRRAAQLSVTYDPELGYPRTISIDYEPVMVDDEVLYRASELEALP